VKICTSNKPSIRADFRFKIPLSLLVVSRRSASDGRRFGDAENQLFIM